MLKVGVTGGIGSGKSLVCRIFSILNIPVYNADAEARRIMSEDMEVHDKLAGLFGNGIITREGPDRKALAAIIFNDPEALKKVNEVVHPAVLRDFMQWTEGQAAAPYVIKEAAIIFESGLHKYLDTVILVTAPAELRLQRVITRDGEKEIDVKRRMENQWPDEKKIPFAGLVLENDGNSSILPVILEWHDQFRRGNIPEA